MRKLSAVCLLAVPLAGIGWAETIVVDDQVMVRESSVERPARGMTMAAVESKFGAPAQRHAAVGQPPITRWDYGDFAVFFEFERVVHAVALR